MENQQFNGSENNIDNNKRLAQDNAERQHAANSKSKLVSVVVGLILVAVIGYFYFGSNNNNVVREPDTTMVQQTPAIEAPAVQAPTTAAETTPATAPTTAAGNTPATTVENTPATAPENAPANTTTNTTNSPDMLNQPASTGDFNRPTANQMNPTPDASTNSMDAPNTQGSVVNGASTPAQ